MIAIPLRSALERSFYYAPRRRGGGIMRYRDPSACLSHGAAALGYRHAGCLQPSHRRPPQMCGLRTRPRTDVNPPSISGSNCHRRGRISSCRPRGDTLLSFYLVVCPSVRPSQVGVLSKRIEVIFKTKAGAVSRILQGRVSNPSERGTPQFY